MTIDPQALQTELTEFAAGLRRAGVKMTPQRWEVFREVAQSSTHPGAEAVFLGVRQRIPSISLDTVYRTLWLLLDLGLLATLGHPREPARFDANPRPHHHFICTKCGTAYDVYSAEFDRLNIPDSVKSLGKVEKAQVEIRGTCNRCSLSLQEN